MIVLWYVMIKMLVFYKCITFFTGSMVKYTLKYVVNILHRNLEKLRIFKVRFLGMFVMSCICDKGYFLSTYGIQWVIQAQFNKELALTFYRIRRKFQPAWIFFSQNLFYLQQKSKGLYSLKECINILPGVSYFLLFTLL